MPLEETIESQLVDEFPASVRKANFNYRTRLEVL
jgi:hypothetical protein